MVGILAALKQRDYVFEYVREVMETWQHPHSQQLLFPGRLRKAAYETHEKPLLNVLRLNVYTKRIWLKTPPKTPALHIIYAHLQLYIYIYVMYMMHDSYGTSLTREWLMFFLRSHMAAAFVRVSPVRWPVRNGRFRATAHCYVDVMPNAIQVGVNRGVTSASETWLLVQWEDFFPKNIWLNGEWVESESLKVWKI